ncbi:MAG: hypothetical protein Q9178_006331 [Gyalolechia marmorata]
MATLLSGPWNPAVAAKQIAGIEDYSNGRIATNVVSGWFKQEFTSIGQLWLKHAERYSRSREFIACLKGIWTEDQYTFKGNFYQFHDYPLKPKSSPKQVGHGRKSSKEGIPDPKHRGWMHRREGQVKLAVNVFIITRKNDEETIRMLQEIQGKASNEAVDAFGDAVKNAGASTANKTVMWADSKSDDLVQYNGRFKTKLIGTPEQIADRTLLIKSLGLDILWVAFLHYKDDIRHIAENNLTGNAVILGMTTQPSSPSRPGQAATNPNNIYTFAHFLNEDTILSKRSYCLP